MLEIAVLSTRTPGSYGGLFAHADISHMTERIGLFIVIVLGETVLGTVTARPGRTSRHADLLADQAAVMLGRPLRPVHRHWYDRHGPFRL